MRTQGFHLFTLAVGASALVAGSAAAQVEAGTRNLILPYLGSAPETGVQYGATAFRIHQPLDTTTRPGTMQLFASYTAKRQARVFAEVDRWTSGSDWHLVAHLEWKRFPLPFYGFGDDANESAEEFYTPTGTLASALVQRRVRGPLFLLGGYDYQNVRITPASTDGALASLPIRGKNGGRVSQVMAGGVWDDRDDVFASSRGSYLQVTTAVAATGLGSSYDFRRHVLDARHFVSAGTGRVVALQGVVEMTDGAPPFDAMSLVGSGSYLRGYTRGRFRERDLVAAQAEYRAPLWRKYRWAAFAGAGRIAHDASHLFGSEPRTLPSYGVGVRRTLFSNSRSAIRVDYARGTGGQSGLYVALNEAF